MNFVCTVFEIGDKMLTLSSMENLIVQCNHHIYGHGGHLGHVTSIISSDFHFLVPESFHALAQ